MKKPELISKYGHYLTPRNDRENTLKACLNGICHTLFSFYFLMFFSFRNVSSE